MIRDYTGVGERWTFIEIDTLEDRVPLGRISTLARMYEIRPNQFIILADRWRNFQRNTSLTVEHFDIPFEWIERNRGRWVAWVEISEERPPTKPKPKIQPVDTEKILAEKFWPWMRRLTAMDERLVKKILCR